MFATLGTISAYPDVGLMSLRLCFALYTYYTRLVQYVTREKNDQLHLTLQLYQGANASGRYRPLSCRHLALCVHM